MEIVIGFQGREHVTPGQLGRIIGGLAGTGEYVLETQNELAATMQSANQIQISTGDLVMQGRGATVEAPETLTIESGVSGQNRNDLVVARYEKNASSSVEKCELKVIKGTAVSGTATDPSCTKGDIIGGDLVNEMPLWRVPIEGITPGTPVKLFETIPSIDGLRDFVSQGRWSGRVSVTNEWWGVYYGTAAVPVPHAGEASSIVVSARCNGAVPTAAISSISEDSIEVFVSLPYSRQSQAVTIDWICTF